MICCTEIEMYNKRCKISGVDLGRCEADRVDRGDKYCTVQYSY